jgi:ubiquinone/menaquinone biosynthesis C-methylase UbiE
MINESFKASPEGFDQPTKLPSDADRDNWLKKNKDWWEKNPMRYDFSEKNPYPEFSKEFYEEIDRRHFLQSLMAYQPFKKIPFDNVNDYEWMKDKSVLEIGVGNGSHAQVLAQNCREYTGIDLTSYAVTSVSKRMEVFGIRNARILQMNAENLTFPDCSFDFVWSWGVIHHTAHTVDVVKEISRVLKPGGRTTIMVYYRGFYYYYFGMIIWLFKGYFLKGKSLHHAIQDFTDGAIARYYTKKEFASLFEKDFDINWIRVTGQRTDILPLPGGKLKRFIMSLIPVFLSRFMTNQLQMGQFLFMSATKK